MDRTSVLSPRAQKNLRKKKKKKNKTPSNSKKKKNKHNSKSTDSTKRKKKHKKSTKRKKTPTMTGMTKSQKIKQKLQQKAQCLQHMFMGDNNYWRQYFDEVLSPANRFPLPPQSPATTVNSELHQSKSQKDLFGHSQSNSDSKSIASMASSDSDTSTYCAQYDREMATPPERLPELDHNFYIYEFALLHDMDWNIRQTSSEIKQSSILIERELRKQSTPYFSNHFVPITTTTTTTTTTTRHFIPRHMTQSPKNPKNPSLNQSPTNLRYNSHTSTDGEELIEPTPRSLSRGTHIKEYPEQHYDVSKLKRHRFTQDAKYYTSMNMTDKDLDEINKYVIKNDINKTHSATESTLSETMDLFTNSKDIEWLNESLSVYSDKTLTSDDDEGNDSHGKKAFGFDDDDDNSTDVTDNSVKKLAHSVSLKNGKDKSKNTNIKQWSRPKVKKYNTIGSFADWEDDDFNGSLLGDRHSRTTIGSMRLNNLTFSGDSNDDDEPDEPFSFEYFYDNNQTLDIRRRDAPGKYEEKVLSSDYLTFELDKECDALEVMINKVRQENELLHEIPQLNLKDISILDMVLTQLSEYSLSYSNQSLVLDIACDILKEITEIPQMGNKNESRAQCVEYQASVIDVGKTSCIHDLQIWQNTVLGNTDFISQEKYDINVMKQNRINENRPRDLYTDLKHKTLTIHDPTQKGAKKENKVLDCSLIKSFNYTQNPQIPDYDTISITYWPERPQKNKRHFNGLVQKYVGHRFVALMKTYITPKKVPAYFKFGRGPFTVERMFPNRLIDFELPDQFPISFMLNLLQQKYVELSLMEKWCWSVQNSSSWMTDSYIVSSKNLKSRRTMQIEKLIKSFNLFLKFQGYELVSMLPQSGGKTKRLLPRASYSNIRQIKTVRTNWLDSKLDQLSVPHILCSLVPCLAEYLHDCWLKDASEEDWAYCEHHSYYHKYTPWLVNWDKLPPSGKNIRIQQAVILIKGAVAAGMFFKPRELTPARRVKR